MNIPAPSQHAPMPPRLSMDAYAELLITTTNLADPARTSRQKGIEEHIDRPFRIAPPSSCETN